MYIEVNFHSSLYSVRYNTLYFSMRKERKSHWVRVTNVMFHRPECKLRGGSRLPELHLHHPPTRWRHPNQSSESH